MDRVGVRVKSSGKVVQIARNVAEQWVKRQPNEYELVSPPKIEVLNLKPLVEKKSVEVVPNVLKDETVNTPIKNFDQVKEVKPEPKKAGRPKRTV